MTARTEGTGSGFYRSIGVPSSLSYEDHRFEVLLEAICRSYDDKIAIVDGDQTVSYRQLFERARASAADFRRNGVRSGDTVLFAQPNGLDFVVGYVALCLLGATVSLASPLLPLDTIIEQVRAGQAVGAMLGGPAAEHATAASLQGSLFYIRSVNESGDEAWWNAAGGLERSEGRPSAVVHLGFTGGTTGEPKAVQVLHHNLVANITQLCAWRLKRSIVLEDDRLQLHPFPGGGDTVMRIGEDRVLFVPPLFHAHALVNLWFFLVAGMSVHMVRRFSAPEVLRSIEADRINYITGSPGMWKQLLESPLLPSTDVTSVTVASSGGAPMPVPLSQELMRRFPNAIVSETYGMTEATLAVTSGSYGRDEPRPAGSAGAPLPDTSIELRPLDEDADLDVAEGVGEIWVRGPQITPGYLGNEAATREQFVDGWLRTGDLGIVDEDGFLVIVGRSKDVILYNGYSVYPRELEDIVAELPQVLEVAVVGWPDPRTGEMPVAFVVPVEEAVVSPEAVMAHVASRVVPYKKLRDVVVVDSLPRSRAGKILKRELRDRFDKA